MGKKVVLTRLSTQAKKRKDTLRFALLSLLCLLLRKVQLDDQARLSENQRLALTSELSTLLLDCAREQDIPGDFYTVVSSEGTSVWVAWPLCRDIEDAILDFVHIRNLEALESQFDAQSKAVCCLKEKFQTGNRSDMTSKDKRRLAAQISRGNKKRTSLLKDMVPHIQFLQTSSVFFPVRLPREEFHSWCETALSGSPFWSNEQDDHEGAKNKAKGEAVELFLKINRALEHISEVLPRELKDAYNFYCQLEGELKGHELSVGEHLEALGCLGEDEQSTDNDKTTVLRQFCSGLHVLGRDALLTVVKARKHLEIEAKDLHRRLSSDDGDLQRVLNSAFGSRHFCNRPNSFRWPSFSLSEQTVETAQRAPHLPTAAETARTTPVVRPQHQLHLSRHFHQSNT